MPIAGLVIRIHVQDAVIVDPVPAQVETLEHDARAGKRAPKHLNKIVPRTRIENGALSRFSDPGGRVGYEFLVKDSVLQLLPQARVVFITRAAKSRVSGRVCYHPIFPIWNASLIIA
ncbi:hypothetical protein [Mesorhizobium shangrilense]|uniref:Uncharacterized protein n=1 Tax=Mesorhizobium shangrilense TaxID=460060 RepID=A0ABV2DPX3_9HYPH